MKLSKHFDSNEFACRCGCGEKEVSCELVSLLEKIRVHYSKPVHIVSGRRCHAHNIRVGGAKQSQHLLGTAADIVVRDVKPSKVADWIDRNLPEARGLGRYKSFTHVDVRSGPKARW